MVAGVVFESSAQLKIENFREKFESYQAALPRTRLHLVFNQPKFAPGDTAWFKAYFLAEDLLGVAGKQLITLNLVNAQGEAVVHFMFNVFNGVGHNQLVIPEETPPGLYMVTAHSSWMQNFDPPLLFQKEIEIAGSNALAREAKPLEVFPEGGHLIRNVANRVVIDAGAGGASVELTDGRKKVIDRVVSDKNGYASLIITPEQNETYYLKVNNASAPTPMPAVEDDGISVQVSHGVNKPIIVLLAAPPDSPLLRQEHTVIVTARGKICHHTTIQQKTSAAVELEVPRSNLPEGIVNLAVLNQRGELLAERNLYFDGQGAEGVKAGIATDRERYLTRDKVELSVALTDRDRQPVEGEFSVSVASLDLFDGLEENTLPDQLNIFAAVSGRVAIDRSEEDWFKSLDNYLVTVANQVPWRNILSNETRKPLFGFTNRIKLVGRAFNGVTSEPVPDFTQIMFYLQKDKRRYQTFTTRDGLFGLEILDIFGDDELFYMAQSDGALLHDIEIEWLTDSIALPHPPQATTTQAPDKYGTFAAKARVIDRSYSFFAGNESATTRGEEPAVRDIETIIKESDNTFYIADYVPFPSMEDLIREVIGPLFIRKRDDRNVVRVKFLQDLDATGEPLYVIDGIATSNTAFFLSLNPSDVVTIKIVSDPRKLALFGFMGKNGIVIVDTRMGDQREPVNHQRLISGLSKSLTFTPSDYSKQRKPKIPDFRSTVYWNPFVKTDANGKASLAFYCPDNAGKLQIRIDGLTSDGKPFTAVHYIETKASPE